MKCRLAPDRSLTPTLSQREERERWCFANFIVNPLHWRCPKIKDLYFNAGHRRNGLVTGPDSARLAADLLLGRGPIIDAAPYALDASR
jgi:glycine/D-amino acid oxidase-like deaminating enzyme